MRRPLELYLLVLSISFYSVSKASELPTNYSIADTKCDIPSDRRSGEEFLWQVFVVAPGYNRQTIAVTGVREAYDIRVRRFIEALDKPESDELRAAFKTLNYGQNEATNLGPMPVIVNWAPKGVHGIAEPVDMRDRNEVMIAFGTPKEKENAILAATEAENVRREQYARSHPLEFVDQSRRELPINVSYARFDGKKCWVITCLWECGIPKDGPATLGHVIVYCLDASGTKLLSWVSCD